jgi:hypothetical protein
MVLKQETITQAITTKQFIVLKCKPITNFKTPYYPKLKVGLGQVDLGKTTYN